MSKKPKPTILTMQEMEKKGTKELLGYLKRLHKCEESFESSDLTENPDTSDNFMIYFKETKKWKTAYRNVKFILRHRENIE
jgi:hypothetical protein